MVEKSNVVEECSSCVRLKQEIEIARKDQAATLKMIKEKIMSTDKLIKKYQKKCDDFDKQAKLLNDLTAKHENCERNTEILQEQLNHSLEVTDPQKKTIKRLIQEKFVAEETIQELKQKNIDQEEVINHLKHGLQLRDEKDSAFKLEQQLLAKQIEKEKKRVEKFMKELEKAKEDIKTGKGLVREKNRELRAFGRKCENLEFQLKRLKEELKYNQTTRKLSPRELNRTRRPRQSANQCEEKTTELLSDSTKECNSPTGEKTPLTSIFDEMTHLDVYPLSPVPPSPTESKDDSSSESREDNSSACSSSSDSEGESLVDLEEMLELKLGNKDATSQGEAETTDNLSPDEDEVGCLEIESGDEDVENKTNAVSSAGNDKNSENSEQIIQEESEKELITDNYLEKDQRTPEKRQSKKQVTKASTLEGSDTECNSPLSVKDSTTISSEELISKATSKVSSMLSTCDSTAKDMEADENTETVGNGAISTEKMSFDKQTTEEVDIQNNNLSVSSLNQGLKDALSVVDERENDLIGRNIKVTCSEKNDMSITNVPNDVKTELVRREDSAVKNNICGSENGAVHTSGNKTAFNELLSEKNVKILDVVESETKDVLAVASEFGDGDNEFADHTTRLPLGEDEGNHTKDTDLMTENMQHVENDTLLLTADEKTSKYSELPANELENKLEVDSGLPLKKVNYIRSDVPSKCTSPAFDNRDDTLQTKTKITKDSLKKFGERLGDTLPEQQEYEMECGLANKLDEKVGLLDKNLGNIGDEETSFSKRDTEQIAFNLTVENSHNISNTHKTPMNTKCEKSMTPCENDTSEKTSSLLNDNDKVLELKEEEEEEIVDKNLKGTKRSNTGGCDTRKKHKRVAVFPEVVAATRVNSTPTETIEATLESTLKQSESDLSTAGKSRDDNDTVSMRMINLETILSNDETLSNNDVKSSNVNDNAMECHLDSIGESNELLNKQENVVVEKSSCNNKVGFPSGDSTNNLNKDEAGSHCCDETSMDKRTTIMDESTEEVIEEGETSEVVNTNSSALTQTFLDPIKDVNLSNLDALDLEDDRGKTMMEIEALTSDDVADSSFISKNNPSDDSHQNDFTAIKESISIDKCDETKSKSAVPSLSVINDYFSVFDEEIPILSPLPSSPCSSRESSPTHELDIEEERTLTHFTSLPAIYAAATPTSSASRMSSASSVSQATLSAKGHEEPSLKLETPRQDACGAGGHELIENPPKKQKKKKNEHAQLSVRPKFLTEIRYADKVMNFLTHEHVKIDAVVSRLSDPKTMSNGTPLAAALVKFPHNEDLMPVIIQKYHDRDRQHQDQASRLAHLNNWTPVLSVFEERIFELITRLSQVERFKGLSTKVISLLSKSIVHSCSVGEEPVKKCVASNCRLLCALCRRESNLELMRVLCYDIIRSLYSRPGTVLYLIISIAAVWPLVLASSAASLSTTSTGLVRLAGESYQPLPCTIQMVLTTWTRSNDWVLLGNILDWLCAWKQVPSGGLSLQQLAGELVKLMKNPSSAQLISGKDGNPILGFGLYEVIKALELVTCVLGWAWLNNVLVREYLWDILARWLSSIQPETNCTNNTTTCLNDGTPNDGSNAAHPLLDSSLSTSANTGDTQGTNLAADNTIPCLSDGSRNDGSNAAHPSMDSSISISVSTGDIQGTNHAADISNSTAGVLHGEPTVVAAIRLLGLACRIAIQHYQTIPQVMPLLVGLLQMPHVCSVPYAVQLASAYSLLEVSPWQPTRVASVLDEWKSVQDQSNNALPESLIQGLNSLNLCLQLRSRDSSLLFESCSKIQDKKHEDIQTGSIGS